MSILLKNSNIVLKVSGQEEKIIFNSNASGANVPVGSIIAVDKNFSAYVDTNFWKLCNGATVDITLYDGDIETNFILPNLTDNRFLIGSDSINESGGNNNGHWHDATKLKYGTSSTTTAAHSHNFQQKYLFTVVVGTDGLQDALYQHTTTLSDISFDNSSNLRHSHTVTINATNLTGYIGKNTATVDGNDTNSNIPKYLTVDFYMKIK